MTARILILLSLLLSGGALAACGGGDSSSSGSDVTVENETAAPGATPAFIDGYLVSADQSQVVLRTPEGDQNLSVLPEDVQTVGIGHLASHAGLTDIGFRVYYQESGGQRYIKSSEEIAPPFPL